jgi:hypothetical protein
MTTTVKNLDVNFDQSETEGPTRDAEAARRTLDLHGHESDVDTLMRATTVIAEQSAIVADVRRKLDPEAEKLRKESERMGVFAKKINARGTNVTAAYSFKNSFANVDAGNEAKMVAGIGQELFERLYMTETTVKLRKGMGAKLKELLGDRAGEFLEVAEILHPVKDYLERRFEVHDTLDEDEVTKLDLLEAQFMQKPALSTK